MIPPEVLRRFPYFRGASEDSLKTLAMISSEVSFRAGQELFREGEPADWMYVLTRGSVHIQYATSGGERRTVDRLGEGDLVVWSAVVDPYVSTAFGVAVEDSVAIAIDAARLRQLIAEDGELGYSLTREIVKVTANRLRGARSQIAGTE